MVKPDAHLERQKVLYNFVTQRSLGGDRGYPGPLKGSIAVGHRQGETGTVSKHLHCGFCEKEWVGRLSRSI